MARVPLLDQRHWDTGSDAERAAFADALRAGLETTGFAVVERHGIDPDQVRRAYVALERFFAQDDATKRRAGGVAGGARGYTGFGVEHAKGRATPDLKEFFHVGPEWEPGHPRAATLPPNCWPDGVPDFREALAGLFRALEGCAERLLEALAAAYGLAPRALAVLMHEGNSVLRAAHYPALRDPVPDGALRAAPHEDINLITLLCEATDAGLEILTPSGWQPLDSRPGQIVVDAGDMLSQVTGGVIPSTTHRVVNPPPGSAAASRPRHSLPFFAHPPPERDLSVLDHFATPVRCAHFPPITAGAFLEQRLQEIGLVRG